MAKTTKKSELANKIYDVLDEHYPDVKCSLNFNNPLELLVATQLAAQCTDKRVNIVTADLFKKYKNAADYAGADLPELEEDIKPTGFFRNKAKNIKACCEMLIEKYNGVVPNEMDALLELPGVGRKTANVILGEAYGIPGMVVDTHAGRLSRRFGLTKNTDPTKVEMDIMKILPAERWNKFSHLMIEHGRNTCKSRKPDCDNCFLSELCGKKI